MGPNNAIGDARSQNIPSSSKGIRGFNRIQGQFLRRILLISFAAIVWNAAAPFEGLAHAAQAMWAFHCSAPVRWGDAILPAGDYAFSIPPDDPRFVTVYQSSGRFIAKIAVQKVTPGQSSSPTFVFTTDDGDGTYVTSLYVSDLGSTLTFTKLSAAPQTGQADMQAPPGNASASGDSELQEGSLFAVHNSTKETVPYLQAEALYLSACKVVEQEFHQAEAVRPRLTLIVGAASNGVEFPKHEIQLKKWDRYEFAQGVVMLAVDDLLPIAKRISLTKLAINEAESTVDLSALRNERGRGALDPRN